MSVGLLLISHEGIASNLLATAKRMLGVCPLATRALEVPLDASIDAVSRQAEEYIGMLNQGNGVLILTDLYGGTPSNIARGLLAVNNIKMITGLNLPMLVRILNYPELSLDDMLDKALSGGQDGILLCNCKDPVND